MDVLKLIPPHEKRILEAHVRGVKTSDAFAFTKELDEYQAEELKNFIKMRMQGFPLQYILGTQDFYGREFYVNTCVLIPRPETEGLVELVLKRLPAANTTTRYQALDFGTGSGCIALTMALERPDLYVWAAECSEHALEVALENAKKLLAGNFDTLKVGHEPRISDFEKHQSFDVLVSNPPYLHSSDEIAEDVLSYEPHGALFTPEGTDPFYFYEFLADLAAAKLKSEGFGAFEISHDRAPETAAVFEKRGFKTELHKDLAQRLRYLIIYK